MQPEILRQWALLIAGALASMIGGIAYGLLGFSWTLTGILIVLLAIFLVLGANADTYLIHQYHLAMRKHRPQIGILSDIDWSNVGRRIATWTNVSPEQWKVDIEKHLKRGLNVKVRLITTSQNFDPYTIVVNPYGGVYPEHDTVDLYTLNKILRYVKNRGLFVNVADIPGYWAYNALLQRRVVAVPLQRDTVIQNGKLLVSELPLFSMIPWMQRLGLRISNTVSEVTTGISLQVEADLEGFNDTNLGPIDMTRAAQIEDNMQVLLGHPGIHCRHETVWSKSYPDPEELTPMFFVSYGNGEFLVSLLNLESHQPTSPKVRELIIAAMLDRVRTNSR